MKSRNLGIMAVLAVVVVLAMVGSAVLAQGGNPVVNFSEDDAAMNSAMAAAKDSLPVFFDALNDPASGADSLLLKVAISTDTGYVEHIWVEQITEQGDGRLSGVYANQPVEFKADQGDTVAFSQGSVSDWSFMRNGQLHGNYTTRVMLPYVDAETAAYLTSILAPLPEVTP